MRRRGSGFRRIRGITLSLFVGRLRVSEGLSELFMS